MTRFSTPRPPALSRLLLILALQRGFVGETIEGDLHEEFDRLVAERSLSHARSWYRRQARRVVFAYAIPSRLRRVLGLRSPGARRRGSHGSPAPGPNPIDALVVDLRFAVRHLRRHPAFALVVILTLAVAIGANTAVLSVVDSVLLRPLPYDAPERLVAVHQTFPPLGMIRYPPSEATVRDWQERSSAFTRLEATRSSTVTLVEPGGPTLVQSLSVSSGFFDLLGVRAAAGRVFAPGDASTGAAGLAVLSHGLWQRGFGGRPDVVGRTLHVDEVPVEVVGVAPRGFFFTDFRGRTIDLWRMTPAGPLGDGSPGDDSVVSVVARLRPGVTLERARASMDALAAALLEESPDRYTWPNGDTLGVFVEPLQHAIVYDSRRSLLVLLAAGAILLVIAWINIAVLMLADVEGRRREVSVQAAIGARRIRLVRQLVTESLLLCMFAGLGGLALARWASAAFLARAVDLVPLLERTTASWRVAAAAMGLALASAGCGLVAAVWATRGDLGPELRAGCSLGRRRLPGRRVLLSGEIALALMLVIAVGLLVATAARLNALPLGFDPDQASVMTIELPRERYAAQVAAPGAGARPVWTWRPEAFELVNSMVDRVAALPTVTAAGAVNMIPFGRGFEVLAVHIDGSDRVHPTGAIDGVTVNDDPLMKKVTPDYFRAMAIPVLRGRAFSASDDRSAPPVVIVNQRFVDDHRLGDNAINTPILVRDGLAWRSATIVGVVGNVFEFGYDVRTLTSGENVYPNVYLPYAQLARPARFRAPATVSLVARYRGDGTEVTQAMQEVFRDLDARTAITELDSLASYVRHQRDDRRLYRRLMGSLAAISLSLALIGVYSVVVFDVRRRIREVAIRMALGARAPAVVWTIVREGLLTALIGTGVGVFGAVVTTRLLDNWLYDVSPTDPSVFIAVATVIVAVTLLACWVPARRAGRVDPIVILRAE